VVPREPTGTNPKNRTIRSVRAVPRVPRRRMATVAFRQHRPGNWKSGRMGCAPAFDDFAEQCRAGPATGDRPAAIKIKP